MDWLLGPNTSKPHPQHKLYPYLLRGVDIIAPNQVWSTDITVSDCYMVLCTWWRSSTGTAARCWHGGYRTQWMPGSVWIAWRKPLRIMARQRYSTPIKGRSSPATASRGCWLNRASPLVWTGGGVCAGQYLCWTAVADGEVWRRVSERIWNPADLTAGVDGLLLVLQRGKTASIAGLCNTQRGVPHSNRWRCEDCR